MRLIVLSSFLLAACSPHRAPVDPGAVKAMTVDHWPTMFAALGPEAFDRANSKMLLVADRVAQDPNCERVEYVGVSQSGSTPRRLEWFVDCPNDYRARLSEDDLSAPPI